MHFALLFTVVNLPSLTNFERSMRRCFLDNRHGDNPQSLLDDCFDAYAHTYGPVRPLERMCKLLAANDPMDTFNCTEAGELAHLVEECVADEGRCAHLVEASRSSAARRWT